MSMTRNSISLGLVAALCFGAASVPSMAGDLPTGFAGSAVAPAPSAEASLIAPEQALPAAVPGEQTAQYSPVPPRGRVVSDHDHARQTARAGENMGFSELMRSAQSRGRGEYLGVEPDISRNVYRFKFLRAGGNVVWVDVDGRTGRVLAERD